MKRETSIAATVALLFTLLWVVAGRSFPLELADFPAFYTGAKLALAGEFKSLHDSALQSKVQMEAAPSRISTTYFVRPHVYAAVLSPLGLGDLRMAFAWFLAVQAAILLAVYVWAGRTFGAEAVALASLFPMPILGPAFGQDCVLYLGIVVLSYCLHTRRMPFASGLVMGLSVIKPHLVLLIPLAMAIQGRWRMLSGFVVSGASMALASVALAGTSGALLYLRFLQEQRSHLSPYPEKMLNIDSLLLNAGIQSDWVRLALLAGTVGAVYVACRSGEWWMGLAAGMAGTLVVAPHTIPYDAVWLMLPAWLVFYKSQHVAARIAATCFFTPIPYFMQLAGKPWTALPGCILLCFVVCLAWEAKIAIAYSAPALRRRSNANTETPAESNIQVPGSGTLAGSA